MLDKYNREITTLRISVTDRCNLHCIYCNPLDENGQSCETYEPSKILSIHTIAQIVRDAVSIGIHRIKLTGGEPLLRKEIVEIVETLSKIGGITDLSMTTNGIYLAEKAFDLKKAGLDRVNISLDSLDPIVYRKITGGGKISKILRGIKKAKEAGLIPIKINMVYLRGTNSDELNTLRQFADENDLKFQTINRMDLHEDKSLCEDFCTDKPPVCSFCNRIRLMADGYLLPCLFSNDQIDINDFANYKDALIECIARRPRAGQRGGVRLMCQIGG